MVIGGHFNPVMDTAQDKLIGSLDTDGQTAEDIIRSALKQVAG